MQFTYDSYDPSYLVCPGNLPQRCLAKSLTFRWCWENGFGGFVTPFTCGVLLVILLFSLLIHGGCQPSWTALDPVFVSTSDSQLLDTQVVSSDFLQCLAASKKHAEVQNRWPVKIQQVHLQWVCRTEIDARRNGSPKKSGVLLENQALFNGELMGDVKRDIMAHGTYIYYITVIIMI